jgi:Type II secretion system (T2SS), protein G
VRQKSSKSPVNTAAAARKASGNVIVNIIVCILILAVLVVAYRQYRIRTIMDKYTTTAYNIGVDQVHRLDGLVKNYVSDTGALPRSFDDLISIPPETKGWQGLYTSKSSLIDPFFTTHLYTRRQAITAISILLSWEKTGIDADHGNWESPRK